PHSTISVISEVNGRLREVARITSHEQAHSVTFRRSSSIDPADNDVTRSDLHERASCSVILSHSDGVRIGRLDFSNNKPRAKLVVNKLCVQGTNLLDEILVERSYLDPLLHELPPAHPANVPIRIEDADDYFGDIAVDEPETAWGLLAAKGAGFQRGVDDG